MPVSFALTTRSLSADTAARAWAIWGVAGVLLAAGAAWLGFSRVTLYEVSPQARLELREALQPLTTPVAGTVLRSTLVLGAEVSAGQVLVELDARDARLALAEAQALGQGQAAQLQRLLAALAARQAALAPAQQAQQATLAAAALRRQEAEAALADALVQARRLRGEAAQGSVSAVEASQAEADARRLQSLRDVARAEHTRLQAEGQAATGALQAELAALERDVAALRGEQARQDATVQRLALEIERHLLRAPAAGRVSETAALRAGDAVAAGQKLASLIAPGELIMVAEFEPATALGRVAPGQPARLRLDGFAWTQYGAVEATVSRVATELRDRKLRVELTPRGTLPRGVVLQHGLPGTVEIAVDRLAPAQLLLRASGQWL